MIKATEEANEEVWQTITVRRQWNDWKKGIVRFSDLRDFHVRTTSGGIGQASPYPMLYARMWCDALVGGDVSHSCRHGPGPHEILVCIVQKDNDRKLVKELKANARQSGF